MAAISILSLTSPSEDRAAPSRLDALAQAKAAAKSAKLHYVTDRKPGIARRRAGKGWSYRNPDGSQVRDVATLARIRSLAIPPAYREVWICADPLGHLQATGKDARGRKQYRYHPKWRSVRDETKYHRVLIFARALPRIRVQVAEDLARPGLPREKILATVIRLMEATLMRVGNEEYARQNESFGLTTLLNRHVEVNSRRIHLSFKGKSGVPHAIDVRSPSLARIIRRLRELPGQDLFQYVDEEGGRHAITSADVNDYLRAASGEPITAKDFRTWAGTRLAALALAATEPFETQTAIKSAILRVVETVAKELGNTPAICRKCYIHPLIFDSYMDGTLIELACHSETPRNSDSEGLTAAETAVIAFLEKRLVAAPES